MKFPVIRSVVRGERVLFPNPEELEKLSANEIRVQLTPEVGGRLPDRPKVGAKTAKNFCRKCPAGNFRENFRQFLATLLSKLRFE